jgi:hypothetical protein
MPLSTRVKGQEASGNQVMADLVPLGQPGAAIADRLQQIHHSTGKVKERARNMSAPMRQTYVMLLLGLTALPELMPGVSATPSSNVLISNMAGPAEQLYLGGGPVRAMLGMPILPPSPCLNITFVSIMGKICLGVASTPEAMSNPGRYIELLLESLDELEEALAPAPGTGKRGAGGKARTRKAAAAKAIRRKPAAAKAPGKKPATAKATRKKPAAAKANRKKKAGYKPASGKSSAKTTPAKKRRT